MDISPINISHIKARFKVNKNILFSTRSCFCNNHRRKEHKNICVLNCKKLIEPKPYTFIIFYSGDINVVGLRKEEELQTVLTFFCCYANITSNHILTHPIIDNITAKGRISL